MIIAKKILSILLMAFLLPGLVGSVFADEVVLSPEEALLTMINEARQNPLEMAVSMGMDPEKILADLPELAEILQAGLPPLTPNENLGESAFVHTWDMFARGYYSNLSPDGRGYDERIRETGYPAAVTGESLGMILFANFIGPDDAVRLIFEYMFQDELDPLRTEKRNILDPCLKEAGVSIQSGALVLNGARWNVYLATCDFGSVISCLEDDLLQLINQARENPLEMASSLGMVPEQILADFPEQVDLLTAGLPPLMFNLNLAGAARAHAADMQENDYFSSDSLDGRTFADRIEEADYDILKAGESIGYSRLRKVVDEDGVVHEIDAPAAVRVVFTAMLTSELAGDILPAQWNILNPVFTEVGLGVVSGQAPSLGGICSDPVELVVADFGTPQEEADPD